MHCMFPFCTARCEVRSLYAEERVHLIGGIFVCAALMVNEYVVGALELSHSAYATNSVQNIRMRRAVLYLDLIRIFLSNIAAICNMEQ